jgi:hypothetical protein
MADEPENPCDRAERLRKVREAIVTGKGVSETEMEAGNGTRRRVKFGAANLAALNQMIAEAQAECDKLNGRCSRRFAIVPR